MRIGIVAEPPRISSCVKIITKQGTNLMRLGHEVFIVMQQTNLNSLASVYPELFDLEIIRLKPVPFLSRKLQTILGDLVVASDQFPSIDLASTVLHGFCSSIWLQRHRCESLLCQTTFTPLMVLDTHARSKKFKKVIYMHDVPICSMMKQYEIKGAKVARLYESWVLSKADEIVCQSNLLAKVWLEEFGVNSKIIYPGCDPSPSFPFPKKDYIFSMARWDPDRKPFFLIHLMKHFRNTNLKLVVGGTWSNKSIYEKFRLSMSKEKLQNHIVIVRNLTEQNLTELYRGARCQLYPVRMTFGVPALEAAAQGTPIVYPRGSGAWEIFTPGIHGFEVIEGNIGSYVDAVSRLQDDKLMKKLSYSIWKKSKEYSWFAHAKKMETVLK